MTDGRDIPPLGEEELGHRMVEVLYGESDAELPDNAANELESFQLLRNLLAELPDEDPPQAISAKLLSAAAEAAKPVAARSDREGFWSRLRAWLQPVVAHPALAAAASLIVVVAVGGALYLSGRGDIAEPTEDSSKSAEIATSPPTDTPAVVPDTSADVGTFDTRPTGDVEEIAGQTPPLEAPVARDRGGSTRAAGGRTQIEKAAPARNRRNNQKNERRGAADKEQPAKTEGRVGKGALGGLTTGMSLGDEDDSAGEKRDSGRGDGPAATPTDQPSPGADLPASPPPARAPEVTAQSSEPAKSEREVADRKALDGLTAKALKSAGRSDCRAVKSVGDQVRKRDGLYYDTVFLRVSEIARCYQVPVKRKKR